MEVQELNGTKVYNLTTGKPLPSWLGERARRNLSKRDESVRHRVEIIQDFQFHGSSTKIRQSPDGRYVAATGTYPPSLKMYTLADMSMKFERRLDSEAVDFMFLGEDYGKVVILESDRNIEFQAPYGTHYKLRIPTFGRGLGYESSTCDLHVTSSGGEVYRINLAEGRFMDPLMNDVQGDVGGRGKDKGTTCIDNSPTHRMMAVGCEDGTASFYDSRTASYDSESKKVGRPFTTLDVAKATRGMGFAEENSLANLNEVTSLAFSPDGINMAFGQANGCVALYDIRSSKPLHIKEHQYGLPIHTVSFHAPTSTVMSGDARIIKAWRYGNGTAFSMKNNIFGGLGALGDDDEEDEVEDGGVGGASEPSANNEHGMGSILCNIEGSAPFRHFMVSYDDQNVNPTKSPCSGLVLAAGDQSRMQAYYAPVLGPAPRWCSFLDSITEELEERTMADEVTSGSKEEVYDDYKFLTKEEVDNLGINNLVGTPMLRGYMHGYFIEASLYSKIRSVANPFEYEEYRKRKIKEKIEEKRASRITSRESDRVGKGVNKELADRLMDKKKKGKNKGKAAGNLLGDDRFGGLFDNPDFTIDEDAEDFKLRNPSGVAAKSQRDEDMDSDSDGEGGGGEEEEEGEGEGMEEGQSSIPAGFDAIGDTWGGSEDDEDEDDDDGDRGGWNSDSDDSAFNEDGYRNAKVRGEMYEGEQDGKKKKKKKKKKKNDKKKKARKQMFESSAFGDDLAMKTKEEREMRALESEMELGERIARMKQEEKEKGFRRIKSKGGVVREFEMHVGNGKKKEYDKKTEGRSRLADGGGGGGGKRRRAKF